MVKPDVPANDPIPATDSSVGGANVPAGRSSTSGGAGRPGRGPRALRASAKLAVSLSALLVATAVTARIVQRLEFETAGGFDVVAAVTLTVLGYTVVCRAIGNAVGWCLLAGGIFAGVSSAAAALAPTAGFFSWLHAWSPWLIYGLLPVPLLFFPDGKLPSANWVSALRLALLGLLIPSVALAVVALPQPNLLSKLEQPVNSVVRSALVVAGVGVACTATALLLSVAALVKRWIHATGDARQQLKWLAVGAACMVIALIMDAAGIPGAWIAAAMAMPTAATVAVLRYRLYDIDLYINRSIVYLATSLVLVAMCAALIPLLASTLPGTAGVGPLVIVTGCLVLVVDPLRRRIQRALDHALRGDRNDPYAAIARLGRTIVSTSDASQLLAAVVENVAVSLRLPYVAVLIQRGNEVLYRTETGRSHVLPTECFPMTYQEVEVGRLIVARRSAGEPFTAREVDLLGDLARHAGIAAHSALLTLELQRSREQLRRDLEEERRKLRHDLHDSIGPMLAGLLMQAGAGRAQIDRQYPARSAGALEALEQGLLGCVSEVRRLINGLHRPASLDQLGLVGAIQESARTFEDTTTQVTIEHSPLPELPAAVEVAAYRIVNEALTNVVKHSHARLATVHLEMRGDALFVCVIDDGVGIEASARPGEGLHSMRERASELGGSCVVERLQVGTKVEAGLPTRSGREQ